MIRVGFLLGMTDLGWLGGLNYYKTLFDSLHSLGSAQEVFPVVIVNPGASKEVLNFFKNADIISSQLAVPSGLQYLSRRFLRQYAGTDYPLLRFARRHKIRAISHSGQFGANFALPVIGWIADFQHVHLPGFFSAEEIRSRDAKDRRLVENANKIVVSSENAKDDFLRLYPIHAHKAAVLQFASSAPNLADLPSAETLSVRYELPQKYYYLPNQFWTHKNHSAVIEALQTAIHEDPSIVVVCTGNQADWRYPSHFGSLQARITNLGLTRHFRTLGVIPYSDVCGLMRDSVAVINPSFFEGWSTTVEEAKSLGKKLLLSGINVHREQAGDSASYFDPQDPSQLSKLLVINFQHLPAGKEERLREAAHLNFKRRFVDLGLTYQKIVTEAVGYNR